MHDIIRKCNIIIDLSKFSSNEKKLSKIVTIYYNHVCVYSIKIKDNVKVCIYIYIYIEVGSNCIILKNFSAERIQILQLPNSSRSNLSSRTWTPQATNYPAPYHLTSFVRQEFALILSTLQTKLQQNARKPFGMKNYGIMM